MYEQVDATLNCGAKTITNSDLNRPCFHGISMGN